MRLVELVAGAASSEAALDRARALGEALGKQVIAAADGPGFLVNRCNRPFSLEALRIVQERLATPEQVDRICRRAAGFRMGPFELMDLVGDRRRLRDRPVVLRADARAALAAVAAGGADGRGRPAGAQVRPGLVRLSPGPAGRSAAARPGRRAATASSSWPGESELADLLLAAADGGRLGRQDAARRRRRAAVPDRGLRRGRGRPAAAGRPPAAAVRRGAALRPGPGRRVGRVPASRSRCSTAAWSSSAAPPPPRPRPRPRPSASSRRSAAAPSGSATGRASSPAGSSPSSSTRRASR